MATYENNNNIHPQEKRKERKLTLLAKEKYRHDLEVSPMP